MKTDTHLARAIANVSDCSARMVGGRTANRISANFASSTSQLNFQTEARATLAIINSRHLLDT